MKQKLLTALLNLFGIFYLLIEKYLKYPDDYNILGVDISNKFQKKTRKELCEYMDIHLPRKGFYDLNSTTKIRLGCQLLENCNKYKNLYEGYKSRNK
ncbi:hypothetical protein CL621_00895 [archaeon]|nr:hypothetical protein [archaeon]